MKKSFFVGAGVAASLLLGCKGEEGAKCCPAGGSDSVAAVSDAADSATRSGLILEPTADQIAKARRVGNKHCPTDGEKLGSMGNPISVVYKGELVELCCAGCPKEFAKDPDKYLAVAKADTVSN